MGIGLGLQRKIATSEVRHKPRNLRFSHIQGLMRMKESHWGGAEPGNILEKRRMGLAATHIHTSYHGLSRKGKERARRSISVHGHGGSGHTWSV
eukprot:883818-Pelagomonas_calceolata.AAC.3